MTKPYIIGITGPTASGKTFVVEQLKKHFGPKIVVLSQDNYYKDFKELVKERWERADYDRPESFLNNALIVDLKNLKAGEKVSVPIYDFTSHSRLKKELEISPAEIIILEGIFIFNIEDVRSLIDLKVFLESDADVRLARRLLRDILERGQKIETIEKSIKWYLEMVKPQQEKYILPMKKYADLAINTNEGGIVAVDILKEKIHNLFTQ